MIKLLGWWMDLAPLWVLLVFISMFWWAGCTQQEEPKMSRAEKELWLNQYPPDTIAEFDPTKHYIVSVDTVGFEWDEIVYMDTTRWAHLYPCAADSTRGFFVDPIFDSAWIPTLDTTWADKEHLLVTPEEKKKLLELVEMP